MQDPTRDEMIAVCLAYHFASEADEFDREAAMYWFANDWHSAQRSNLYSALSTSPYSPGPLASKPSADGFVSDLYLELVNAFGG